MEGGIEGCDEGKWDKHRLIFTAEIAQNSEGGNDGRTDRQTNFNLGALFLGVHWSQNLYNALKTCASIHN